MTDIDIIAFANDVAAANNRVLDAIAALETAIKKHMTVGASGDPEAPSLFDNIKPEPIAFDHKKFTTVLRARQRIISRLYTPTEIGKRLKPKIVNREINRLLCSIGFQKPFGKGYILTDKGAKYGKQFVGARFAPAILWRPSLAAVIQEYVKEE